MKWRELSESKCLKEDTCDISEVALDLNPLRSYLAGKRPDLGLPRVAGALLLLAALVCFFVASAVAAVADVKAALESRAVYEEVLGLSERSLRRASWAEVARRLVEAQKEEGRRRRRRSGGGGGGGGGVSDDDDSDLDPEKKKPFLGPLGSSGGIVLDEPLIAARIMRRDNYLIALLAEGLLPLAPRAGWLLTPEEGEEGEGEGNGSKCHRAWRRFASLSRQALRKIPFVGSFSLPPSLAAAYEWNLRAVLLEPMFVLSTSPEAEESDESGDDEGDGGEGGQGQRRQREREEETPPLVVLSPEATDPAALAARSRRFALLNALAAPFALALLFVLLFMRHAERLYHHPSTAAAREWSRLARWRVREFNELPRALEKRLARSRSAAERYVAGFPSPASAAAGRFVAFVAGSCAALLLLVAVLQDRLLERSLWGRHLVWWIAFLGIVLAGSRSWAEGGGGGGTGGGGAGSSSRAFPGAGRRGGRRDGGHAPARSSSSAIAASFRCSRSDFSWDDQDAALLEVASFTHFYPNRWRGRGGSRATQQEFEAMFPLALTSLLLSEVAALVAVPLMLWWDLPRAAADICAFVAENTVRIEGVGDVCSLSAFRGGGGGGKKDGTGGNGKDGDDDGKSKTSSAAAAAAAADDLSASALALLSKSREGKLEKSLLSFAGEYPGWRPDGESRALLEAVARKCRGSRGKKNKSNGGGSGGGGAAAASSLVGSILLRRDEDEEGTTMEGRRTDERERRRRDTAFGSAELQAEEEEEEIETPAAAASRVAFLPGDGEEDLIAAAHLALLASLDLGDGGGEREREAGRRGGSTRAGRAAAVAQQQPAPAPPPPPPPQSQPPQPPRPIRFPASSSIAASSPQLVALRGGFGSFGEEQELASLSPSPASFFPSSASQRPRPAVPAPAFPLPPPPQPPSGALARQLRAVVASAVPPPVAFDAPLSFSPSAAMAAPAQQQRQQQQRPPPSPVSTWPPPPMFGGNGSDEEAGRGENFFGALGGEGSGDASNNNASAAAAATTTMMPWAAMPPDLDEPALDTAADPWGVARGHQ